EHNPRLSHIYNGFAHILIDGGHAERAARLGDVFFKGGSLALTLLSQNKQESIRFSNFKTSHLVIAAKGNARNAHGGAPGWADLFLVEAQGFPLSGYQQEIILTAGHSKPAQFVSVIESDGNQT